MGIFDGLPNPAAPALAFQHGMRQGTAEREEREVKGALSAYAMNPDDPAVFETLARVRPEMAISIREDQTKRQQAAQVAELTRRAAAGDPDALRELAPIDLDAWAKLDARQREHIKRGVDYVGQAALAISKLPPDQRAAAWDEYAQRGVEQGFTELADEVGGYSEEALQSALAEAGLVRQAIEMAEPQEFNVGPGEGRYQRDPITGGISTVIAPNPGDAAPFSPVGGVVAEGATATNPQTGEKIIFRGGQWVPTGGGASNGAGNFQ
jgi:hypothetical protein